MQEQLRAIVMHFLAKRYCEMKTLLNQCLEW